MQDNDAQNQAVDYLKTLQPGYLPVDVFLQFARLMVIAVIELVSLRRTADGELEVLLVQRPEGDVWSNVWHVPGTVIRATDKMDSGNEYEQPLQRLLGADGELQGITTNGTAKEIETERRRTARGDELAVIHYVEVTGEPKIGTFYALSGFPDNVPTPGIMPHHIDFVRRAADRFVADNS